jgi:hypothetical protein
MAGQFHSHTQKVNNDGTHLGLEPTVFKSPRVDAVGALRQNEPGQAGVVKSLGRLAVIYAQGVLLLS